MKKLYLLLVLFAVLTGCSSNDDFTSKDLSKHQLKGNVESVKVCTYEAYEKFGQIVKGKLVLGNYETIDITEFDKLGNISAISRYDRAGNFDSKRIYNYKDNKIDSEISYDADGDVISKTVNSWNNELLINSISYDNKGREGVKIEYEYEGNKRKTTYVYVSGMLRMKNEVLEYEGDLPTETVSYNGKGKVTGRTFTEYKDGKLALYSTENGTYKVDENGLTTKSVDCYNVLNDFNDEIKGIFTYKYEFDKKGNWIKCMVFKGEIMQPYRIVEREIEYR